MLEASHSRSSEGLRSTIQSSRLSRAETTWHRSESLTWSFAIWSASFGISLMRLAAHRQYGPFGDFHPGWQICKTLIQSTHGFSLATEALYWTHIHELPDLFSPALCYSSRVTCDARRSRRALLGFRATAPAPPRFERAAFPFALSSGFRCVEIRAYPCPQGQRRSKCASLHRPRISASTR